MHVLLIEDDVDLAATVADFLASRGVEVDHAYDGLSGLHLAATTEPDVIVLDIGLPGLSGLDLCRRLRRDAASAVPVLILTARDALEDKLSGFEVGADDYLVKPFALAELFARLQALQRRAQGSAEGTLEIADLVLDPGTRSVLRGGQTLSLSKLDFDLLHVLCRASPAAVNKQQLAEQVWGEDYVEPETIRAHIYQLRQVVDRPFELSLIHTIRGYGHAVKVADA